MSEVPLVIFRYLSEPQTVLVADWPTPRVPSQQSPSPVVVDMFLNMTNMHINGGGDIIGRGHVEGYRARRGALGSRGVGRSTERRPICI